MPIKITDSKISEIFIVSSHYNTFLDGATYISIQPTLTDPTIRLKISRLNLSERVYYLVLDKEDTRKLIDSLSTLLSEM